MLYVILIALALVMLVPFICLGQAYWLTKDEIYVQIKNEEVCEKIAKKFYEAVINKTEEEYWKNFKLC